MKIVKRIIKEKKNDDHKRGKEEVIIETDEETHKMILSRKIKCRMEKVPCI